MSIRIVALVFCSFCLCAENQWKISAMTMGAATAVDISSSYGRVECNPLLSNNGQFTTRGVMLVSSITGIAIVAERVTLSKWPKTKNLWVIVNYAIVGEHGAAAIHNWRQK